MAKNNEAPLIIEKATVRCPCGDTRPIKSELTLKAFGEQVELFRERHLECLTKDRLKFEDDIPPMKAKDVTPPKGAAAAASTAVVPAGSKAVVAR